MLLAGCGVSHGEVDVITAERDALANQVGELQDQLEASIAAGAAVEKAERELLALTDSFEKLQANLDEWEDKAKAAELERDTARAEAEKAAAELAAVLLAYDDDIDAARARIAGAAKSFACTWGTDKAAEGETVSTATGESILRAFAQSDAFDTLAAAPLSFIEHPHSLVLGAAGNLHEAALGADRGRRVDAAAVLMRSTRALPASMSTPASL